MPRVLVVGRFRFYIWPHDHPPAHVHVYFGNEVAVFRLGRSPESVSLVWVTSGATVAEVKRALEATRENWHVLRSAWKEWHGT